MPDRFNYCPCCAAPLAWSHHGDQQRQACTRCNYVHWDNPIPVVAAIVEHEGKIVLARNALWPPGMFALITGFMEKIDPSPEQAALREVQEELGLEGEIAGFVGHYRFQRMNQIILAYHVRAHGAIKLDAELTEYRHEAPETLRPWPGSTGDALRDWMLGCGLTPQPWDYEPLRRIAGYRRIGGGVAAGGPPQQIQFLALSLGRTQQVVALGPECEADRRAAEGVGMHYQALNLGLSTPTLTSIETLYNQLVTLQGQHIYVYADNTQAATALSVLCCARAQAVSPAQALGTVQDNAQNPDAQSSAWLDFAERQLTAQGSDI